MMDERVQSGVWNEELHHGTEIPLSVCMQLEFWNESEFGNRTVTDIRVIRRCVTDTYTSMQLIR
jgi:hypothetical protein